MAKGDIEFLQPLRPQAIIELESGNNQKTIVSIDPQLTATLSDSKTGIVTTTFEGNEIVKGNGFQVHRIISIPAGGKKIVADFTNIDEDFVFTLPLKMGTNEGQVYVSTYKIIDYTGGIPIPPINRNSTSDHTANGLFLDGVTSSDVAGDDLREYIIGTLSTNQNSGGGSGGGVQPKIFAGDVIMFDIDNKENTPIDLEFNFNWYEI